ncbi:enoyl-CoA hydratase [Polynucleobacter antarcticus]|uniref:enoyl-CoA hydratase n=1 Tax=Polynucleobacter antarcticus TaxID=1743162 RepID=A0A6M9Q0N4_9BURK|nr:enoyl-CoA hydratase [Polynucleobacter antarcticus]QKM61743.1 enoyl-CoA hydratase [Polynucleobacter antarcticus]
MSYNTILTEVEGKVAIITLNRPQVLNALNDELMNELSSALSGFDTDENIGCIIITGSEKAFAAGADIAAMAKYGFDDVYRRDFISRNWEGIRKVRKPVIAAVSGYALGGGCELAMMCDTIMAADNAKFAQPEIKLGIIPGAGGTQRLPRAISKAKAMDLALTGRMIDAVEAERAGLVARIFPHAELMTEVKAIAKTIADMPLLTAMMVKEAINTAYETTLSEGMHLERRLFHACFATNDQKEGMAAFVEKRSAKFTNS